MEEGTVVEWLVNTGERVTADEPDVVVESDKASFELVAEAAGQLVERAVPAGETVAVGMLLRRIGSDDTDTATAADHDQGADEAARSTTTPGGSSHLTRQMTASFG